MDAEGDAAFFSALQELVAYAFEERSRVARQTAMACISRKPVKPGILQEVDHLLATYRTAVIGSSGTTKGVL